MCACVYVCVCVFCVHWQTAWELGRRAWGGRLLLQPPMPLPLLCALLLLRLLFELLFLLGFLLSGDAAALYRQQARF